MNPSSSEKRAFFAGLLCGMLLLVGANGLHWFLTPLSHPAASPARSYAIGAQVIVSFAVAAWIYVSMRRKLRQPTGG